LRPVHEVWEDYIKDAVEISIPDDRFQFLTDAAIRNTLLHSSEEVVPGPYTYKRFWFRDASLIINSLIKMGFQDVAKRHLKKFPARQRLDGYFLSQEGEWDSNGQVLWVYDVYERVTGDLLPEEVVDSVSKGIRFLDRKRMKNAKRNRLKGL